MKTMLTDGQIRMAAFNWLDRQIAIKGEVLEYKLLQKGFEVDGQRISLVSMQGIFKPAIMEIPLTIRTSFGGPYKDSFDKDGLLKYKYRGTDPRHPENVGLRLAFKQRLPLIYFHGVAEGKYIAAWPAYIVGDHPKKLAFTIAVDDTATISIKPGADPHQSLAQEDESLARRVYNTQEVKRRLHQQGFRKRVLKAHRYACSFCQLRHQELLDAAHIVPDSDPEGVAAVRNGLALCKLHHAAFDRFIVGVSPDFIIQVRKDVLEEIDGPMLKHGLQALDGRRLNIPNTLNLQPDKGLLKRRFILFESASPENFFGAEGSSLKFHT